MKAHNSSMIVLLTDLYYGSLDIHEAIIAIYLRFYDLEMIYLSIVISSRISQNSSQAIIAWDFDAMW